MRVPFKTAVRIVVGVGVLGASGLALLSSDDVPAYTAQDKAYYADALTLNFIRPGVKLTILGASVADDGTIQVRFKLADPKGIPLDRDGIQTAGAVSTRWVAAYIPNDQTKYVAYTTRQVTSSITGNTATQANYDSGSANSANYQKVGDGEYVFTFNTKAANVDRGATHTIGGWAARDLAEFGMETEQNYDSATYDFVPNGAEVTKTRDVIRDQTCNKCHDVLQAHDERRTIQLCNLCHTPQTTDPDSGHTMDLTVMAHKIHMGKALPSVQAGGKYAIIGYGNSEHNYSTVAFPTENQNCTMCHDQNTGAAQAGAFMSNPSRVACGSCHDDVNFETGENHRNMPQLNDGQCGRCHPPVGFSEFDRSITGAHTIARFSQELPGVVFDLQEVRDAAPGQNPTVVVRVTDRSGIPLKPSSLSVVMAGPTSTDYTSYISESMANAPQDADGVITYTMQNAIPGDAKGTFAFGIEGRKDVTIAAGTNNEQTVRDVGKNVVKYVAVDGSEVAPRRQIVSIDKCNQCHGVLAPHGFNRNQIEQCVLCHNQTLNDAAYRPADQNPPRTVEMAYMIHRIHTGEASEREYTIYGYRGSLNDFKEVRYPADRRNCQMCHVNGSENPPLPETLADVQDPRGVLSPMGQTTAACTGCHTEIYSASHALSNTTQLGEACASCHAANREFSVGKSHAR